MVKNRTLFGHQGDTVETHSAGDIDDLRHLLECQVFAAAHEQRMAGVVEVQPLQPCGKTWHSNKWRKSSILPAEWVSTASP